MVLDFLKNGINRRAFDWFMHFVKPEFKSDIVNISLKKLIEEQREEPSNAEYFIFTINDDETFLLCHWSGTDCFSIVRIVDFKNCWKPTFGETIEWVRNGREFYLERKGAD